MVLKTMYPPQKDSPTTFLLGDISSSDTLITLGNAAILPNIFPYPLTLGIDKTITETVMVSSVNLENNQITVIRTPGSYAWPAGTKVARVFTASDLTDIQENIQSISESVDFANSNIELLDIAVDELEAAVGDSGSGLVKELADEIVRATTAEQAETLRATTAENAIDAAKVNRTELSQVITDWSYSADGTKLLVTIARYNASNQQTSQYTKIIPAVTDETIGMMTPEAYNEISALRNDVMALQQQGGRFIGISFATKSALDSYVIPESVKLGDFTYVLDDETKEDSTTRYVFNGSSFDFAFVVNYDPIGIADTETPGLVKGSPAEPPGKVFVETDGTMSVVGWDELNSTIGTMSQFVQNLEENKANRSVTTTTTLYAENWVGSETPYVYSLGVFEVTEMSNQEILPSITITASELEALQGANITDGGQSANTIVLKAYGDKPTINIPIRVIVRGDA